jgi:carbon monoxide dehydrogenase subunit G
MATIKKEFTLDADPARVWDALRDFGALHERLVPGFVTETELDGDTRVVTFANGSVAREDLVTIDDADRRLAYRIKSERLAHHSASAQVFADGARSRFVWITDVLPADIAPYIGAQMDQGVEAMRRTFGG